MWSLKIPDVNARMKREDLFQEISDSIRQWPELEQRIFFQAHYRGQSPEAISRSLQMNEKEVDSILRQCDRRLYSSLRDFCKFRSKEYLPAPEETACPPCQKDLRMAHVLCSNMNRIPGAYRKPA